MQRRRDNELKLGNLSANCNWVVARVDDRKIKLERLVIVNFRYMRHKSKGIPVVALLLPLSRQFKCKLAREKAGITEAYDVRPPE